jgi:AraC-like DNA-binding protein
LSILAYLPARQLRHLQFVLGNDQPLLVARKWDDIDELVQAHAVSIAVIDPSEGAGKSIELEQLMTRYPSLPVIAYVSLTTQAFTTITQLSQTGLKHVVLYSHDDGAQRFLPLIDQVQTSPLTQRVIDRLRPRLVMLPLRLAKTFESLFAEPHRFPNAQDLATQSTIPLVRVYRAFHEAGLATPKKVFIAAKMLKAYAYLGDPAHSVNAVSKKLGYRHTRIFADHSGEIFNLNPSRLHTYMTKDEAVERVLRFVELESDESVPSTEIQTVISNQG